MKIEITDKKIICDRNMMNKVCISLLKPTDIRKMIPNLVKNTVKHVPSYSYNMKNRDYSNKRIFNVINGNFIKNKIPLINNSRKCPSSYLEGRGNMETGGYKDKLWQIIHLL